MFRSTSTFPACCHKPASVPARLPLSCSRKMTVKVDLLIALSMTPLPLTYAMVYLPVHVLLVFGHTQEASIVMCQRELFCM